LRIGGGGRLIVTMAMGDAGRPFGENPAFSPAVFSPYISRGGFDAGTARTGVPGQARILGLNRAVGDLIGLGAGAFSKAARRSGVSMACSDTVAAT